MKFAIVETQRQEARPGLPGLCPACGATMVARCGEIRVHHWAHRGKRHCDHWWEPETEWHRAWKDAFPVECQEIVQMAEDGEKHVADVKTAVGRVIEFQHSRIEPDERRSREAFYRPMDWVVDGLRRKRDQPQFAAAVRSAERVSRQPPILAIPANKSALLRDWGGSRWEVFFDFGGPRLWLLQPKSPDGMAYVSPVPRAEYIKVRRLEGLAGMIPPRSSPPTPGSFQEYAARYRARARSRGRL